MQSKATTVAAYLAELPADRRAELQAVRKVILANLDEGFKEGMQYGAIGYFIPHSIYPPGYHCDPKQPLPFAGLGSQKNHLSVGLMCVYSDPQTDAWFRAAWARTGKKLDMGKVCIRFKKADDLALDVIAEAVRRITVKKFIAYYEDSLRKHNPRAAEAVEKAKLKASGGEVAKPMPKKKAAPRAVRSTSNRGTAAASKPAGLGSRHRPVR
jgi:hypothetical protein